MAALARPTVGGSNPALDDARLTLEVRPLADTRALGAWPRAPGGLSARRRRGLGL